MRRLQLLVSALPQLLLVILLAFPVLGQLPPNKCYPHFVYQGYQGHYTGLVSVRLDPRIQEHTLRMRLSQESSSEGRWEHPGLIVLADGEVGATAKVEENARVDFRVIFPDPASPPSIISIRINGEEICRAPDNNKPGTEITLFHTFALPIGFGPNWKPSFPAATRNPITNPNPSISSGGHWEESFPRPTRNPITDSNRPLILSTFKNSASHWEENFPSEDPTRNQNRAPERREPVYAEDLPTNDTFLARTSFVPSSPSQPEVPSSARELLFDRPQSRPPPERSLEISFPPIQRRDPLVPQQAPSPSSSGSIQCGRERATTTPFIFQGTRVQRGQIPWLVGMFERRESNGPIFFCGGTLIAASTVLTAAHCFRIPGFRDLPASRMAVSLGRNSLDLLSDGEFRGVSELIIHDKYKYETLTEADLALARLETPVPFDDFIVPICLWSTAHRLDLPQGQDTYVAGWGPDESGTGNSDVAKLADMKIVSEATCLRELPPGPLSQPSTLCARKAGTGPCSTDGGGPLMLREGDVWLLRGVIAGGAHNTKENTCDLAKPSVFTDVAKHIDWVRRNMWN